MSRVNKVISKIKKMTQHNVNKVDYAKGKKNNLRDEQTDSIQGE